MKAVAIQWVLHYHVDMKNEQYMYAFSIAAMTVCVYALTVIPLASIVVSSYFLVYIFVATAGIMFWPFARHTLQNDLMRRIYFLTVFVALLLWIGVTGWFVSPFFYFLYLMAIVLGFVYSSFATFLFVLVLVGIFLPNVGSIDFTVDIVTLLSLSSVVPLTYYLQKEYLHLKQAEKKILILEEYRKAPRNRVDEVLTNKISRFSVDLRQPINDIRQVALHAMKAKKPEKVWEAFHKVTVLGREALDQIEEFEVKTTGKKLIHTSHLKKE